MSEASAHGRDGDEREDGGGKKANKPLMEKRRRARINKSLGELKVMLVNNSKSSSPGHSKWEKADILEMTVQHMRTLQANRGQGGSDGAFLAGFTEALRQLGSFAEAAGPGPLDAAALNAFLRPRIEGLGSAETPRLKRRHAASQSPGLSPSTSAELSPHSPRVTSTSQDPPIKRPVPDFLQLRIPGQGLDSATAAAIFSGLLSEMGHGSSVWRPW